MELCYPTRWAGSCESKSFLWWWNAGWRRSETLSWARGPYKLAIWKWCYNVCNLFVFCLLLVNLWIWAFDPFLGLWSVDRTLQFPGNQPQTWISRAQGHSLMCWCPKWCQGVSQTSLLPKSSADRSLKILPQKPCRWIAQFRSSIQFHHKNSNMVFKIETYLETNIFIIVHGMVQSRVQESHPFEKYLNRFCQMRPQTLNLLKQEGPLEKLRNH